mmetsp:Transcript_42828/g.108323  ORF Transcript_42828/g.108323 Transcript_42828/m.108323 type:complete len:204 (+) Transcript_42828:491-1102(+)
MHHDRPHAQTWSISCSRALSSRVLAGCEGCSASPRRARACSSSSAASSFMAASLPISNRRASMSFSFSRSGAGGRVWYCSRSAGPLAWMCGCVRFPENVPVGSEGGACLQALPTLGATTLGLCALSRWLVGFCRATPELSVCTQLESPRAAASRMSAAARLERFLFPMIPSRSDCVSLLSPPRGCLHFSAVVLLPQLMLAQCL